MIPFPGPSWHDVITQHLSMDHLLWSFVFTIACGVIQCICWLLARYLAPILMDYSVDPAIPNTKGHQKYYQSLINVSNSDFGPTDSTTKHSLESLHMLSDKCCNGELSDKEVGDFLESVNQHKVRIQQNEIRFSEALFPIITKGFTLTFGILAVWDEDWVWNRALFWKGWPYHQGLDCCAADIKLLICFHIGWYLYKLFAHLFIDRQLKDATANVIHHLAALTLLFMAYWTGFVRAGVVILLLHDPADFVLSSAKFCKRIHQTAMMNVFFCALPVVWFVTRIVVYPYHAIASCWFDWYEQFGNHRIDVPDMNYAILFLSILYILHLYWFYLIVLVIMRRVHTGEAKDVRSDEDTT